MKKYNMIKECNILFRDIINFTNGRNSEKQLEFLKIDNKRFNHLCSSMDVIDCVELSKDNFYKYGLSGPTKIIDKGEELIRLYGILSAIYLEINAIIEIIEISKIKNKKKIIEDIKSMDIYFLRNVLSSHTTNYLNSDGSKNSYIYSTHNLDNEITIIDSDDNIKKFNIKSAILDFDIKLEEVYFKSIKKYLESLYNNSLPKELNNKFNILNEKKEGSIVIENYNNDPIIVKFTK